METLLGSIVSCVLPRGRTRSILKKLKTHCDALLIPSIACILISSGCSTIDGTRATGGETTNFVASIEHEKPVNPRAHPGRPYAQEIWMDQ
jgi:hypothetical protein